MEKIIIVSTKTGKAVQNWTFADRKHVIFCQSPQWAMSFPSEESADGRIDYLRRNFGCSDLTVLKVKIESVVTIVT